MEHSTDVADPLSRQPGQEKVPASEVRKTLSAILRSAPFHSSKQSQELLQYIVDQTLAGRLEMLKERIIGANVFNRRADYDTNSDPIVRARASEVRKRLALYYQTARGEEVLISVPSGSFRATFEWADRNPIQSPPHLPAQDESHSHTEPVVLPVSDEATSPPLRRRSATIRLKTRTARIALAAVVVLAAWAITRYLGSSEERAFHQFWTPVLDNSKTALIYIGSNAVYELSPSYVDAYYRQHPRNQSEEMGLESYIPLAPGTKIDAQDLYPAKDTFVTIGDVAATTKVVSLLVHRNKQFDVRFGNDVAYGDLRENPTILIGAHNNPWTIIMTLNLRYVFNGRDSILDRSDPRRHWSANTSFTDDYAIISRVLNSKTGTPVFMAAGIGHAGTRAAAEFLTNSHSIAALVKSLPGDWARKNIQIVLHTSVINQIPSAPDVIATYCW